MECPPEGPEFTESDIKCKFGKHLYKLGKSLDQDEIRKFASFFHDSERTAYLLQLDQIKQNLEIDPECSLKSAEESTKLRTEGNKLFTKKKFQEALKCFNKSVMRAPMSASDPGINPGSAGPEKYKASEELVLALGNRSAALQFTKKYELSIRDIDLAFEWDYPAEQKYKLWDRRGKCLIHLGRKEEAIESLQKGIISLGHGKLDEDGLTLWMKSFDKQIKKAKAMTDAECAEKSNAIEMGRVKLPDMQGKPSVRIECANEDVGLRKVDKLGRDIVALNDISVGDVLLIEEVWSGIVYPASKACVCNHCSIVTVAPLPCHQCSDIGFCGIPCRNKAWETTHYVECKFMNGFSEFWLTKIGYVALMISTRAGYKTLREYFGSNLAQNINRDDLEAGFTGGVFKSNYKALFHMETNNTLRLPDVLVSFSLMSILMLQVLKKASKFWEGTKDFGDTPEEMDKIIATSIMHHMQIVQCNAYTSVIVEMSSDFKECKTIDTGLGVFPTLGLVNHSCDPNCEVYNYGNTMISRAARDIRRGESITMSYGMNYYSTDEKTRKMYYMTQFYFNCACRACKEEWPLWDLIEHRLPIFKCDQCDSELPPTRSATVDCPKCNRITDLGSVLHRLEASHECFAMAMDDVMKWELEAALPVLEEHLRLMQIYIKSPWREIVTCQATIQQIYNIFCNRFQNSLHRL